MDEDFESLIVTNPELVDPGIDVSGLRTQTDTSLLGSIPDFAGIQYEAFNPRRLSDLMKLYSYGLPAIDTSAATVLPTTGGGGTGDGGQATAPITTPTQPDSIAGFDPGVTPGPSGFIGLDPDMDIDPRDIDDYGTYTPPTPPSGITSDPITIENIGPGREYVQPDGTIINIDPLEEQMLQEELRNELEGTDTFTPTLETEIIRGAPDIFDINKKGDPALNPGSKMVQGDDPYGIVTQEDLVDNRNLLQKLGLPADFDLKKAALEAGINLVAGVPITLLARGLGAVLPQAEPTFTQKTLTDELGLTDDRKFSGDPTTSAFAGLNAFGQFGDPVETAKDRIDTRLENIENKNYKPGDKFYDDTQTMIEEYNRVTNKLGDIDAIPTGDAQIAEETIGTLPEITEARQEQGEYIQEIEQQKAVDTTTQRGRDEADRQKEETGVAKVETDYGTRYESSGGTFASAEEAAEKGDGPSGGGGKIVCTMMNESYGFGSFRNKIWMKFHKDLSPEYQKGYHKLFLPLVKIAKKNIIVKKVLEHIAVHSTIDMRQSMRGKTHLLGRVYRKILLPLCYWVGKNG